MMIISILIVIICVMGLWLWVCRSDAKYWKAEHDFCEEALFSWKERCRNLSDLEKKTKLDLQIFIERAEEKEHELKEEITKLSNLLVETQGTLRELETDYTTTQENYSKILNEYDRYVKKYEMERANYIHLWKSIYDIISQIKETEV